MTRERLRRANRAIIEAIETPPDTGIEDRLDDLAAELAYLAEERSPDPGRLARVRHRLDSIESDLPPRRARYLRRAKRRIEDYGRAIEEAT